MAFIGLMNKIDDSALDGRLLKMFVTVHQTGSVTAAAMAMNVTQSTVSHGLNRLRAITGDDLFVPSGRSITPTERADALALEAQAILDRMASFARGKPYDPAEDTRPFVIAATDFEIELFVKPFIHRLRDAAPGVAVHVLRALPDREWVGLLRSGDVDLVLAPELKGNETDIKQRSLLNHDHDLVYFDARCRTAPETLDAYSAADHVIMSPAAFGKTPVDHTLAKLGRRRRVAASLPSFSDVASVLAGTDMVTLMPARLKDTTFRGLASCASPFAPAKETISAIWHIRSDGSARHRWMRTLIGSDPGAR